MTPTIDRLNRELTSEALDQLFLDCAELETLIASVRQAIDQLDPAVDAGLVTVEHLMNLAFRTENAQRGLIAIAQQISDTATTVISRRQTAETMHWADETPSWTSMQGCAKN